MTPDEAIAAYGSAWTEPDLDKRIAILESCWADDGLYIDPSGEARGRDALAKHMGGFIQTFAEHHIDATSAVDAHDGYFRFAWKMFGPDNNELMEGVDFGQLDGDGRITLLCGFFGPWPALATT